ncbi:AHH domain-containing protein [Pyxidicoccus trucidator]|uniref:AHH domain-containing protein n=1 Tax=Pyxidicoccus trucidator TaxID=2709662 RepID=UPI0013DC3CDD|nr:AHH domain-containing protein [Pyxidicoccus trucidator]
MRICGIVALLTLAAGCVTTRVVHLDTGQGTLVVHTPVESAPVEIDEDAFKSAVAQLVLDLKLDVALKEVGEQDRRSLLASAGGIVDGTQGRTVPASYERICRRQSEPESCLSLLAGGSTPGAMERRTMALYFALDTVWEGVEEAIRDLADPVVLRAMITTMIGTALILIVAPEPITKLVAIALTASLIAYLGTGPVWHMGRAFLRLLEESKDSRNLAELKDAGHRFGKVLGANGTRVLVLVALAALGGKNAMAAQRPRLPGAAQAAMRAQAEGGFQLSAAFTGEVQAMTVPAAGVLNITLAPTAVAAVALGTGGGIQGDLEGEIHHICTNKNEVSDRTGGPWSPIFEDIFKQAGMTLNDTVNLVRIKGHKGSHTREYHQEVLNRIARAMKGCKDTAQCRTRLVNELSRIAHDLTTPGTMMRRLIMKEPGV